MSRPQLQRIQHVAMPFPGTPEAVRDARRFYGEILGLDEIELPDTLIRGLLWFRVGQQELYIYPDPRAHSDRVSTRHPCFQADDVASFRVYLQGAGIETITGDLEIPGRQRFFVRDPFGNAIEISEFR